MYPARPSAANPAQRYSAKNNVKPVNFICMTPTAQKVSLVGDFNEWNPDANPFKRQPDGNWMIQVQLTHGHHHYLFWVDGDCRLDPRAQGTVRNAQGEKVSMVSIS